MSDCEPAFIYYDVTDEPTPEVVDPYITKDEKEAIEFADLFVSDCFENTYGDICSIRGLDPVTQEPWTDEAIQDYIDRWGCDPRDAIGQLENLMEIEKIYRKHLETKEGEF